MNTLYPEILTPNASLECDIINADEKQVKIDKITDEPCIVFVINGECFVSYNVRGPIKIKKSSFVLIPRNAHLCCTVSQNSTVLELPLQYYRNKEAKTCINKYINYAAKTNFQFKALHAPKPLKAILNQLVYYIKDEHFSDRLAEIKLEEFLLSLDNYYDKNEVVNLFYPVFESKNGFKEFIINNYEKVNNIAELIRLSAMCKTYFYDRFKKEFNMTAKQWILKQKAASIKKIFAEPDISIKDIAVLYDFQSTEYLHKFCKKHFNATPTEMMRRYQS